MAKRKRRAARFRHGDCTLQWRGKSTAVACFKDEGTGKRKRVELGTFPRGSQEARDALVEFVDQRRALTQHNARYTVGQLWKLWLKEREQDGYRNDIYQAQWKALGPVFGNRMPHMLTTQDFRDYAKKRFDAGRSAWTVNTELVRLRACLKWADETDLIAKRPKVWVPSPGKHRDRVLTREEAQALLAAAQEGDPHIHVFVVVAFATGARHTAILDLTWPRVDFIEGLIEFDEDLPPDPMSKAWRKGRATVPMHRGVRAVLELAYRGRGRSGHVVEHGGKRLRTVRDGFDNAVKRAGIDESQGRVTPHTIRHTVVTWLEERDVETRRTAQLVGHRDERTTKRVYTHASPDVLKGAVTLLEEMVAALPRKQLEAVPEGSKSDKIAPEKSTVDEIETEFRSAK